MMILAYGCIENKFRMEFNDSDVHLSYSRICKRK